MKHGITAAHTLTDRSCAAALPLAARTFVVGPVVITSTRPLGVVISCTGFAGLPVPAPPRARYSAISRAAPSARGRSRAERVWCCGLWNCIAKRMTPG